MNSIQFKPLRSLPGNQIQPLVSPPPPEVHQTNTLLGPASLPTTGTRIRTISFEVSNQPASQPPPFSREEIERFLYFLIHEIWSKPSVKGLNEEEKNRLKTAIKNVIRYVRKNRRDLLENPTELESHKIYSDIFNVLKDLYRQLQTFSLNNVEYSGFFIGSNRIRK